jgi:ethanolamine utilization protein EutA (predicted chaperonin)
LTETVTAGAAMATDEEPRTSEARMALMFMTGFLVGDEPT